MAVLYAAKAGNATTSNLYTVDPVTAALTSVGPIGFAVTGMAMDPTTGTMWGVTSNNSAAHPNSLITIDTTTGAGTFVAALNLSPSPDISFRSDGQMFGWTESSDDACSIDKATGTVTVLGDFGLGTFGDGNDFDASDNWYACPLGGTWFPFAGPSLGNGWLATIDDTTGVGTGVAKFSGGPFTDNPAVSAASFDFTDDSVLWAVLNDFAPFAIHLVKIDKATAVVTDVGIMETGQPVIDALAWSHPRAGISLTPTCAAVGATVSVDGTGFTPSTAITATFGGNPITLGGTTTTDGSGDFTGSTFVVPNVPSGTSYAVVFTDGTNSRSRNFTVAAANSSCGFSTVLQTGDCVTATNFCVSSTGHDPLNALLGSGGGHALWFVYTLPALGPSGADVTWTITGGTIGAINAGIISGPCSTGTIQQQSSTGLQTTLAQSIRPFVASASGRTTTTQALGVSAPASYGSYVQNKTLPVTLTAHVNSGETVHLEVDNYDGSAQGTFTVCVNIAALLRNTPVLTFKNYFRAEQ